MLRSLKPSPRGLHALSLCTNIAGWVLNCFPARRSKCLTRHSLYTAFPRPPVDGELRDRQSCRKQEASWHTAIRLTLPPSPSCQLRVATRYLRGRVLDDQHRTWRTIKKGRQAGLLLSWIPVLPLERVTSKNEDHRRNPPIGKVTQLTSAAMVPCNHTNRK
jgi:hypothetical protein